MSTTSLLVGVVFLLAGLYQFIEPTLGGLRVAGVMDRDLDDSPGSGERVGALFVGVVLTFIGLFFIWLGQY